MIMITKITITLNMITILMIMKMIMTLSLIKIMLITESIEKKQNFTLFLPFLIPFPQQTKNKQTNGRKEDKSQSLKQFEI